jgi:N-formylglutamate amidohydrolase
MPRDTDIHEEDVLRNAHSMRSKTAWAQNPEPNKNEHDPRIILDTEDATADAYLWKTTNTSEAWLEYKGELATIADE